MKKLFLLLLCTTTLIAQKSELVYENIFLTPVKSSENLLVEGIKRHNQKYHSKGKTTASLYSVLIGQHSGQYVWLNGPMELAEYDNMPDSAHMENWQKNIRIHVTSEKVKMAKLNWEASYTPPAWGSPNYILWRTFKIKHNMDSYNMILGAVTKIGKALKEMDAPNPRRVYESVFRSEDRSDITLVYPFKSFSRFSKSNGLPQDFQSKYDKINGPGAFKKEVGDVITKHANGWHDEVLMLIK